VYELLGICLVLAALLAITGFGSLMVAIFWRAIVSAAGAASTGARAQLMFFLRSAPAVAAILCVSALLVPAYVANEPRQTGETVGFALGLIAAISLCGIGWAVWRGIATHVATRRLVRNWLQCAVPVRIRNVDIPAFCFHHPFPVFAIVGAVRPRLFVAEQVRHALSDGEIAAAVAHENGHLAARDNIKRGMLQACRNFLTFVPFGRALDRSWMEAAEAAADEYAARGGAALALNLASALVKVARLVPGGKQPAMLAGVSLIAADLGSITARVLRLTQIATNAGSPRHARMPGRNFALGLCLSIFLLAAAVTFSFGDPLAAIHAGIEHCVAALQ
jgi:Zn-dependent protease with chaperone function